VTAVPDLVRAFFAEVAVGHVEIYNEFSLQHELGIHLWRALGHDHKVQFERPVTYFKLTGSFLKKEIDIAVFTPDRREKVAIELKFPRSGQHPEQMFKACQDIGFLEQVVASGFDAGVFVMAADDDLFFDGPMRTGIYAHFRTGTCLTGTITKPTGKKDEQVTIGGRYELTWQEAGAGSALRYLCVAIGARGAV